MGREIRRVPKNWNHPKHENGSFKPMFDQSSTSAFNEWMEAFEAFKAGEINEACKEYGYDKNDPYLAFCHYYGEPPRAEYYRPEWDKSSATWWQVYETVSEGTPVSPPFETQDELIDYLVENGDFWDQERRKDKSRNMFGMRCDPWPREQAEKFVKGHGFAASMVIAGGKIMSGIEAL